MIKTINFKEIYERGEKPGSNVFFFYSSLADLIKIQERKQGKEDEISNELYELVGRLIKTNKSLERSVIINKFLKEYGEQMSEIKLLQEKIEKDGLFGVFYEMGTGANWLHHQIGIVFWGSKWESDRKK